MSAEIHQKLGELTARLGHVEATMSEVRGDVKELLGTRHRQRGWVDILALAWVAVGALVAWGWQKVFG